MNQELITVFQAGALLVGSSRNEGAIDLKSVLASRLSHYYLALGQDALEQADETLEIVQLRTACEALSVVERAQALLTEQPDVIGTRDLAQIRTLLSIAFNWAIQPLLARVIAAIPTVNPGLRRRTELNIIDLTTVPDDYRILSDILNRLFTIILPRGQHGPLNASLITNVLVDRFLPEILRPSIVLGWLPKLSASESVTPIDDLRPRLVHVLNMLPPAQCIMTLSALLSDTSNSAYVKKACSFLLSRQLLRSDGVRGMLSSLFSEEDMSGGDAPLEKLENVAKLLHSLPAGITDAQYFGNIIPQLLSILSSDPGNTPITHRRAASFTLSRFLIYPDKLNSFPVSRTLLSTLQRPFLYVVSTPSPMVAEDSHRIRNLTALETIRVLETLLVNTDPSPVLISGTLTAIIPPLFSLMSKLERVKISDPALKLTVQGLLRTWGRLIETQEGIATVWLIVDGEGGDWSVDVAGEISRVEALEEQSGLALFTPEELRRASESGELNIDANILNIRPEPSHFVAFLKSLDRQDITSEVFARLLDGYREVKVTKDSDPTKALVYLQIIMKLQSQTDSDDPLNVLKKSDQILAFIKHALESARDKHPGPKKLHQELSKDLRLADLRIIDDDDERDDDEELNDGDSDDEDVVDPEEEMTSTSLNLLLAVLEANAQLSTQTAPILDDIFSLLEYFGKEGSESIKPLAREARMVLVARLASSSAPRKANDANEDSADKKYQKALKLLQDPILPVRAHGLLLLREIVSSKRSSSGELQRPNIDPALVPGILPIFLQAIQDDDSYIFLNAVQGLSAMVDGFGKDVLRSLMDAYSKGLGGVAAATLTPQDLDVRTRVGEAFGQVIRRCGDALPDYANLLIPPFFAVVRGSQFPATLRTSALSLLATCVSTSPLAVFPYTADLGESMIDLLQVEAVPMSNKPEATATAATLEGEGTGDEDTMKKKTWKPDSTEFKPATTSTKIPPLRRAALHLLSLILRAYTAQVEEGSVKAIYIISPDILKRARITAGYIAGTDEDSIARVMAREVVEDVDNLAETMLTL